MLKHVHNVKRAMHRGEYLDDPRWFRKTSKLS